MTPFSFEFVFEDIPQGIKEHCLQYPWFATILSDPSRRPVRAPERQIETGNSLFAQTLNTSETLPVYQSFYKSPSVSSPTEDSMNLGEYQTFMCVGSGLDGHAGTSHGGVLSTAIDQAMGTLARSCPKSHPYTKYLHVNFKKPFRTPGAVLCRAWLTRIEGRKMWISGRAEDGHGNPYVTAEALFVNIGPQL